MKDFVAISNKNARIQHNSRLRPLDVIVSIAAFGVGDYITLKYLEAQHVYSEIAGCQLGHFSPQCPDYRDWATAAGIGLVIGGLVLGWRAYSRHRQAEFNETHMAR